MLSGLGMDDFPVIDLHIKELALMDVAGVLSVYN